MDAMEMAISQSRLSTIEKRRMMNTYKQAKQKTACEVYGKVLGKLTAQIVQACGNMDELLEVEHK